MKNRTHLSVALRCAQQASKSVLGAMLWVIPRVLIVVACAFIANGPSFVVKLAGIGYLLALVPYWAGIRGYLMTLEGRSVWFRIARPSGSNPWTRYLFWLVAPGYLATSTVMSLAGNGQTLPGPSIYVTYMLFTAALIVMAVQAYILRDEDPRTYKSGLQTARAYNLLMPIFVAVMAIVQLSLGDGGASAANAIRSEFLSVIGAASLIAAITVTIPERRAAQSDAKKRRRKGRRVRAVQRMSKARIIQGERACNCGHDISQKLMLEMSFIQAEFEIFKRPPKRPWLIRWMRPTR